MGERQRLISMTFADNATESGQVDLLSALQANEAIVGVLVPTGFVGTTLTFKNSLDGGTTSYPVLKIDGTAYTVTTAAEKFSQMAPADTKGFGVITGVADSQTGGPITLKLVASKVA